MKTAVCAQSWPVASESMGSGIQFFSPVPKCRKSMGNISGKSAPVPKCLLRETFMPLRNQELAAQAQVFSFRLVRQPLFWFIIVEVGDKLHSWRTESNWTESRRIRGRAPWIRDAGAPGYAQVGGTGDEDHGTEEQQHHRRNDIRILCGTLSGLHRGSALYRNIVDPAAGLFPHPDDAGTARDGLFHDRQHAGDIPERRALRPDDGLLYVLSAGCVAREHARGLFPCHRALFLRAEFSEYAALFFRAVPVSEDQEPGFQREPACVHVRDLLQPFHLGAPLQVYAGRRVCSRGSLPDIQGHCAYARIPSDHSGRRAGRPAGRQGLAQGL